MDTARGRWNSAATPGFEVFASFTIKSAIFWDLGQYSTVEFEWLLGEMLLPQSSMSKSNTSRQQAKIWLTILFRDFKKISNKPDITYSY
jgi:hypothetical protein